MLRGRTSLWRTVQYLENLESDSQVTLTEAIKAFCLRNTGKGSAKGEAEPDQLFAVNLLDSLESNLEVREELNLGYEKVEATISAIPARKEFWTWIVLLVLLIITIVWYIYNRRVFI